MNSRLNLLRHFPSKVIHLGRGFTTIFDRSAAANFTKRFVGAVGKVTEATDPGKSSELLRSLVKTKLVSYTDMSENPEKFFLAHRLLSTMGLGGFGIRFTVQFNLFAGSIVGLGGPEQVKALSALQESGELGCFLLTETQAGVLSGLIVETTATWDQEAQQFVLHTPSDSAAKNWISQGLTAEHGVVIADLLIKGKSYGPHPFLMRLRHSSSSSSSSADSGDAQSDTHGELGELVRGVTVSDMGHKTVANDLDNARVWFDRVQLPHGALLNKFAFVDPADGTYHTREGHPAMRIEVIGQRLLTGRQAIAEAALLSSKCLHLKTEEYAKQKTCNGLAGEVSLSSLPHIANVFADSYQELDRMLSFAASVERRLNAVLVSDGAIPDADLVDAIAVLKVKSVEVSVARSHALRLEVGSYALMHGTGFELADMLLTCKFAEGDSRILLLKLARDRLKRVGKDGLAKTALLALGLAGKVGEGAEARAALALALKLAPVKGTGAAAQAKALDENWRDVYALADLVCERHLAQQQQEQQEAGGGQKAEFVEGSCVERLKPSNVAFDAHWQRKQKGGYVISEMKAAGDATRGAPLVDSMSRANPEIA